MSEHLFEYEEDFKTGVLVACCSCEWNSIKDSYPDPLSVEECVKLWKQHVRVESKKLEPIPQGN